METNQIQTKPKTKRQRPKQKRIIQYIAKSDMVPWKEKVNSELQSYKQNQIGLNKTLKNLVKTLRDQAKIASNTDKPTFDQVKQISDGVDFGAFDNASIKQIQTRLLPLIGLKYVDKLTDGGYKTLDHWRKIETLVEIAADDLGSFLSNSIPLLVQHGPKILDAITGWLSRPKSEQQEVIANKVINNQKGPLPLQQKLSTYSEDGVYDRFICSALCPETWKERVPRPDNSASAIGGGTFTYDIISNNAGNVQIALWTNAISGVQFLQIKNDATFDPQTGSQTPAPNYVQGPIFGNTVVDQAYASTMAITLIPTVSNLNSQGMVYMSYYPRKSWQANLSFSATGQANQASFQMGGMKQTYRQIAIKADLDDYDFDENMGVGSANSQHMPLVVITIFGASVSATVARIEVAFTFEFIPVDNMYYFCNVQMPPAGSMTLTFINNLLKKFPALQQLSLDAAQELCQTILRMGVTEYYQLMDILSAHLKNFSDNYKYKPIISYGAAGIQQGEDDLQLPGGRNSVQLIQS